ncbi:MAG TPA: MBL fold metallo-hydrolase [Caulobacteraceae bacterium]|jgi:glyoxylase-like metal-dependent hydrolase (beta-lactamase superfamily II)
MPLARLAVALIAALALAGPLAARAEDGPMQKPPAAYSFRLGALRLAVARGGGWRALNDGTVFGKNATRAEVAAVLAKAGAPTDVVTMDVDALVVRLPGHVVLIDAGLGPADHGVVRQSLAMAGVKPAEVTDVLITHGHTDHVDGLVGDDGKPAFPAAVVRMSAREWASMQADKWEAGTARVIAPQVRTFAPGVELLPGITPIALYGHTPGHVGYVIASGGQRLVDIGDIAHSSIISLARPDWIIDFDSDPAMGARTPGPS